MSALGAGTPNKKEPFIVIHPAGWVTLGIITAMCIALWFETKIQRTDEFIEMNGLFRKAIATHKAGFLTAEQKKEAIEKYRLKAEQDFDKLKEQGYSTEDITKASRAIFGDNTTLLMFLVQGDRCTKRIAEKPSEYSPKVQSLYNYTPAQR